MDFRLDFGPWETIFLGQTYGHEVEIVSNPENFFLVIIYDKRDGKKVGAVIEGYKAYFARGAMEAFIQTLPKPCLGVEKLVGDKAHKLFFFSFEPFYLDFFGEDFVRKIDLAVKKAEENATAIVELAKVSSLELIELGLAPKNEYAPILGDPFVMKMLIAGQRQPELSKMEIVQQGAAEAIIQIGLTKAREIVKETAQNFKKVQIVGQDLGVNYSMYIISENLLLENTPVIIFDSEDYFNELGAPAQDTIALKNEFVDFEPIGFPFKQFVVKGSIRISLRDVDMFFLLDMLGFGDTEFQKNFSLLCFTFRAITPEEMIEKVLETKELNEYEKLKAERILHIIDKTFSGLFGESVPVTELTKTIPGKIGIATVLNMKTLSEEEINLFTHTIIRQLTKNFSEGKTIPCAMVVPKIDSLLKASEEKTITAIERIMSKGTGIIVGTEGELPEKLSNLLTTKISIVSKKDVAISVKGKKNYRVMLRPSLSGTPKI